ncbi:MAG: hypothetical protein H6631_15645 [Anaerolineaceae bacterium]|nr:hypothetical protein [Anaerolineaceae bacterium]MCB9098989.1 hypothetical protein [Anaerolineales bacterium]
MSITQTDLRVRVKKFVTNGKHPDCQAVLAASGYGESQLAAGEALLDAWQEAREKVKGLGTIKKSATQAERSAERSAQLEATALREAVRTLWMEDEATLEQFDLVNYRRPPKRSVKQTNGSTNGDGSTAEAPATEASNGDSPTAETPANGSSNGKTNGSGWVSDYQLGTPQRIARWRVLFSMVGKLAEAKQAKLAEFGWDGAHVDQALSLVEKYAQADAAQQKKIKVVELSQAAAQQAEQELRRWYLQASRLTRSAIKRRVSPDQQQYMRDLLGL